MMTPQQPSTLTPHHSAAMAALYQACFPEAWSAAFFSQTLQEAGPRYGQGYGIVQDQCLLGFILGHVIQGEGEILTLCVDQQYRSQGIGTSLLQTFLTASKCHQCFLEVKHDNQPAQHLYKRLGFHPIAIRKGYYALSAYERQDALVMQWTKAIPVATLAGS
jgi:ribosomal-protein-alanine acetyltransferase